MDNRLGKYISIIVIIILALLWVKKDQISLVTNPQPGVESAQFDRQNGVVNSQPKNKPAPLVKQKPVSQTRPIMVSSDEEINVDVFQKVHPSVVNIAATTLSYNFWMQIVPSIGQGSGFIIDRKGYILTNNHVVENARKIIVTLASGRKLSATLIGRDAISDLAVIKIPEEGIDDVATLGDSDRLKVGQKAIAIGNPFGLGHTLTTGIVSALNRSIITSENVQMDNLIQTDTAINPGNSGGPLLNSSGEVIGINTVIYSLSGGYEGIGFAIPINRAWEVAEELITSGRVARPWLGIEQIKISELSGYLDFGVDNGILIVQIIPGSPAYQAGLRGGNRTVSIGRYSLPVGGDIITAIDNDPISNDMDLNRALSKKKVGDTVKVKVYRNGSLLEIPVTLMERPYQ
ncbi:MAG TPA: trypsin-like peptidase domain-containing protein [Desulfatiglandales bacterium]|nr:trypsin-like peptidase domain-containing protein [Desulfatiglandales bacterium]